MRFFTLVLRHFALLFAVIFTITVVKAQSLSFFPAGGAERAAFPKYEMRAVWLTTIGGLDWPRSYAKGGAAAKRQQAELCDILDKLQLAGINTVLLQTRIRGTVIYPSQYEPWDGCLSGVPGTSPGYDALQFAIDECHRRGMELHAWVVTIPVGKWNAAGCRHLRNKMPASIKKIGEEGFMNPENEQTARYLADICEEITRKYDVDGIHLDYIRYPETWNRKVSAEMGRKHITDIAAEISRRVKTLKPWVKMSCSPIGKHDDLPRAWSSGWNAYTKVCQDAQGWLKSGIMDALFPMMYFKGNQFYPFAIDWAEQSYGRIIAPGLGIYFLSPKEKNWDADIITRQLNVLRQYGMGHAYFRSKFFTDNVKGIYTFARKTFTPYPALIPPMTWQSSIKPTPPAQLSVERQRNTTTLRWREATNRSGAPYLMYNVYSSSTFPVDIDNARNIVATRMQATSLQLNTNGEERYYAVTAIDRYGNESNAIQSHTKQNETKDKEMSPRLLQCDGRKLQLPSSAQSTDADMLLVEAADGRIAATLRQTGETINVSRLPQGFYVLKSLNHKGVSHRLGFFIIKR